MALPEAALSVAAFCRGRGLTPYLVGGAVRDALLDRPARDVDVAVDGDAIQLAHDLAHAFGGRCVVLDSARGIARVLVPGDEGPVQVDVNSAPGGIGADLAERDFTIDAMAAPLDAAAISSSEIIDPHGGVADLRRSVIRAVSERSLSSDPVRLLRAVRLEAELGFTVDDDTLENIRREAHLVGSVAPERVRDELLRILAETDATASVKRLDSLGILTRVVPELEDARGVEQPKEHYWDVLSHMLETPGQVERVLGTPTDDVELQAPRFEGMDEYFAQTVGDGHARSTVLKLAALLHDVSKPATKTFEPSGRMRFFGHDVEGADVSARILQRLRCSGRTVETVAAMVRHHLRPGQLAQKGELPTPRAAYRYYRDLRDVAVDTLYLNMADYLAARGPLIEMDDWEEHCRTLGHVLAHNGPEEGSVRAPVGLIDGHDLMAAFSLQPGPVIGDVLEAVREAQAAGEIGTRQEALALAGSTLAPESRRA